MSTGSDSKAMHPAGIQVLARAAGILRLLQAHPVGLTQAEVSNRLGLARSTVSRILLTLESERFVTAVGPRGFYRLGSEIARMADNTWRSVALEVHPFLEELSRELEETVDLSVLDGGAARFIDQVVAPQRLRTVSVIGDSFPLHSCANGKALLATQPSQLAAHLPSSLPRLTPNTITSLAALEKEIAVIRGTGIAVDREEHTLGVSAVGAVLANVGGHPGSGWLAVSVPVPTQRFAGRQTELAEALDRWVDRINQALGESLSTR